MPSCAAARLYIEIKNNGYFNVVAVLCCNDPEEEEFFADDDEEDLDQQSRSNGRCRGSKPPYICGVCGNRYSTKFNVKRHARNKHWNQSLQNGFLVIL